MKDYEIVGYISIGIMAVVAGIIVGMGIVGSTQPTYYANGYCTALGGERLTDETCDVDGRVVAVK